MKKKIIMENAMKDLFFFFNIKAEIIYQIKREKSDLNTF